MTPGFSLLELLIATAIAALFAGAVASVVPPLQAVFEQTPAAIDLQQRGRTAIDAIAQAVRGADRVVLLDEMRPHAHFRQLQTVTPKANGAQGLVAHDQLGSDGDLFLSPERCPAAPDVCGFVRGGSAMIAGAGDRFTVFTVESTDTATRSLSPRRRFGQPYEAGATLAEVDVYTFRLDPQPEGSFNLIRETATGAVQPIVDGVRELRFAPAFEGRGVDVGLTLQAYGARTTVITRRIAIVARNVR